MSGMRVERLTLLPDGPDGTAPSRPCQEGYVVGAACGPATLRLSNASPPQRKRDIIGMAGRFLFDENPLSVYSTYII